MSRRGRADLVALALVLVLAVAVWPARLGGATTLVVVHGDSMEPGLASGDLAVVRSAPGYAVGDVVAFRIPSGSAAGRMVIHRIVTTTEDGFVTRGDNRSSDDPWVPTRADVVGRVVVTVPGFDGRLLGMLPWVSAALIALGAAVLLATRVARSGSRVVDPAGVPRSWPPPAVPNDWR